MVEDAREGSIIEDFNELREDFNELREDFYELREEYKSPPRSKPRKNTKVLPKVLPKEVRRWYNSLNETAQKSLQMNG